MSRIRLLAMVFGTAACALGMGYFVQHDAPAPQAAAVPQVSPIQQSVLKPEAAAPETRDELALSNMTHIFAARDIAPRLPRPASADLSPVSVPGGESLRSGIDEELSAQPSCDVRLSAEPAEMASVMLSVSAPCLPNERLTVHHNGMIFTETTDAEGSLTRIVPALSDTAVFIVQFATGAGDVVVTRVPGLAEYDRVVLQWAGPTGFQLHALEFGAGYGEAGHVWHGSGAQGQGVVTTLGNPDTLTPHLAQVYTFPSGAAGRDGTVALSVEAEITAANCGREVRAQTLELRSDDTLRPRDLTLAVPDCTAQGDFLVLNNLVEDLTIAVR